MKSLSKSTPALSIYEQLVRAWLKVVANVQARKVHHEPTAKLYTPLPTSKATDLPSAPAVARVIPPTASLAANCPPAQTTASDSVIVNEGATGTTTRARALGGTATCRLYARSSADHADETRPIGVSMLAFAQVSSPSSEPGAGGARTTSLHERLPGARFRPARVE